MENVMADIEEKIVFILKKKICYVKHNKSETSTHKAKISICESIINDINAVVTIIESYVESAHRSADQTMIMLISYGLKKYVDTIINETHTHGYGSSLDPALKRLFEAIKKFDVYSAKINPCGIPYRCQFPNLKKEEA